MPMQPHAGVWGALLLACSLRNNVELAEVAWKNCCELEPDSSGYHSLLANIYASAGRWDDAKRLRRAVEEKGLVKIPGSSWTECFESQQYLILLNTLASNVLLHYVAEPINWKFFCISDENNLFYAQRGPLMINILQVSSISLFEVLKALT
ncbi:UNVERIFIED_CONTAM: Pentatricopeptide repeat-containing protein [Sesamum calycinum]|uniref:Pentatricopeptide repeat-containing protein n=1 Tax=Sesamum calycinum TaxID=2727403 RepID=A0AAW2N335_9LAMI